MNIVVSLQQILSNTEEKMKKLYNVSYFIAKHERPFSDFEELCKLHVKNGLSLGETYINDKGCRVSVEAIDGVMKEDESQQVNKQCFISVMAVKIIKPPSCMSSLCSIITHNEPHPSEATTTNTN